MEFFIVQGYNYLVYHTSKQNWENTHKQGNRRINGHIFPFT